MNRRWLLGRGICRPMIRRYPIICARETEVRFRDRETVFLHDRNSALLGRDRQTEQRRDNGLEFRDRETGFLLNDVRWQRSRNRNSALLGRNRETRQRGRGRDHSLAVRNREDVFPHNVGRWLRDGPDGELGHGCDVLGALGDNGLEFRDREDGWAHDVVRSQSDGGAGAGGEGSGEGEGEEGEEGEKEAERFGEHLDVGGDGPES